MGRLSVLRMPLLAADQVDEPVLEPERRQRELVPEPGLGIPREHVEHSGRVLADRLAAGHQPYVRIELGRRVIVVAGPQMDISADPVFLAAYHQCDLAVRLEIGKSVDDVTACLLQFFGPNDVVLLIKSRLEFHEDCHLLAVLRGARERCDDRGIAADAVQGLLDGEHGRVDRCLRHKIHHRVKGLVGVVHEDIVFADLLKNITACRQFGNRLRFCVSMLPELVETVDPVCLHQESQVDRTVDHVDEVLCKREFLHEELQEPLIDAPLYFETDRLAALPLFELLFDLL